MDGTPPITDQMDALAQFLKASPEAYPHALDPIGDGLGFVRLAREALRAASFLDERVLGPGENLDWKPWRQAALAVRDAGLVERCGLIFHIGHVGSTLISRLLEEHPAILSLREPLPFRTLAAAHAELAAPESLWRRAEFDERLEVMLKLWSRTFDPGQLAVVKATSICSEMAHDLLSRPSAPRAIFMYAPPEAFLANLLAGENSRLDIRNVASSRLRRLHRRLGEPAWRLADLSYPQMAAMSWACEMTALQAAAGARPDQALWMDFERFLKRPQSSLRAALTHLGAEPSESEIAAIVAGPQMSRYSKAPEHAYDAGMRGQVLAQARAEHAAAIAEGLEWLERAAGAYPAIAGALGVAGA